ncbi:cytochrome c peroxidase [Thalassomonas sp. RHCl1]|uniref:cytochrome-c peroxidase n=1 Tax=Thalassomonas sp. RHCl1 TaxID=2995320 RepID=UPI00248CC49F|nr:cytochrome c peroxidase [Thalassomonas sp. RHCl1]
MNIHLTVKQSSIHILIRLFLPLLLLMSAAGQAGETSPQQLIVNTHSASEIHLSWQAPQDSSDVKSYRIYRDGKKVGSTKETTFLDSGLSADSRYSYHVITLGSSKSRSEPSNTDTAKTLVSDDNDGMQNGAGFSLGGMRLTDACEGYTDRDRPALADIPTEKLDECLATAIEHYQLKPGLENIRAYVARLRRQEDPALIELGMRLFHSKTLSQNDDTSCSSCHHPALGCGSDGLSLPIGVSADNPELLGLGRSDGNVVPEVGRNSPQICNSALWVESMFWDQRIKIDKSNAPELVGVSTPDRIVTPESDVSDMVNNEVDNTDPLRLLIAQAHFPVTAPAEMGDSSDFESPQSYREYIATKLEPNWKDEFNQAFGSEDINFTRVARALAAYEASFLFIDNPFFDYLDGDLDSLNEDEKRGALFFYAGAGCANCHDGVFFSPERTRGPFYPQIGINAVADGNRDGLQFRMPSLLNIGITGPYGDKGVFSTLEDVVEHYNDATGSLTAFYGDKETCQLPQFAHLTEQECDTVVGGGGEYLLAANAESVARSGRGPDALIRGFTQEEVSQLAAFLRTLTDKSALPGSNEINVLIPPRDGGPDGNQLDAVDKDGNVL